MATNQFDWLMLQLAEHERKAGMSDRLGTVHEVKSDGKEQKVRVQLGLQADGTPFLSPWLHTTDHLGGGSRRQNKWVKGRSVRVSAPDGDYRQATVTAFAESDALPAPDHAKDVDGDSYQIGKLRLSYTDGFMDIWLAGGSDAKMKLRVSDDGGITGRIGTVRIAAHQQGAKLKAGGNTVFVDESGCWSTKPLRIRTDSIPDDDK